MITDLVTLLTDTSLLAPVAAVFTASAVVYLVGMIRRAVRG